MSEEDKDVEPQIGEDVGYIGTPTDPNPDTTYQVTGSGEQVAPPFIYTYSDRSDPIDPLYVGLEVRVGGARYHEADETMTLNWGDGTADVAMPPDTPMVDGHTYLAEGDYTISVTRTLTSTGAAATATQLIHVPL